MIALGLCNIFGSFFQSMPTTGSFSRTAVNSSSGVKTSFGGVYTGLVVILCLAFLMPYCAFIPKATLAAVIMTAVIFSVEHHVIRPMWSSKREWTVVGAGSEQLDISELSGCILLHLSKQKYSNDCLE